MGRPSGGALAGGEAVRALLVSCMSSASHISISSLVGGDGVVGWWGGGVVTYVSR